MLVHVLFRRYLNAGQNKLSRLPSPVDPPEEGAEGARARGRRGARPALYCAPALLELYLQVRARAGGGRGPTEAR